MEWRDAGGGMSSLRGRCHQSGPQVSDGLHPPKNFPHPFRPSFFLSFAYNYPSSFALKIFPPLSLTFKSLKKEVDGFYDGIGGEKGGKRRIIKRAL